MTARPLYIPVILGTVRKGRMSAHAARLMVDELAKRDGVETELVDRGERGMRIPGDYAKRDVFMGRACDCSR